MTVVQPLLLSIPFGTADSTIKASAACPSGGKVSVAGVATATSVNVATTLAACQTRHYTVDGSLTHKGSATASTASITIQGDVAVNGASSGRCIVLVQIDVRGSELDVSGTLCGVDAAQLPDRAKALGLVGG